MILLYSENIAEDVCVSKYSGVSEGDLKDFVNNLEKSGVSQIQGYAMGTNCFYAYQKENEAFYVTYYQSTRELTFVDEKNSAFINYEDKSPARKVTPAITQIGLEDYGMSYVLLLPDSRFIIIDGGWQFEKDADKLFKSLKNQCENKPIIAAWIMTHPHLDHYRCFFEFEKKYIDDVVIEKIIYNFPDTDDKFLKMFPGLVQENEIEHINYFEDIIRERKILTYRPHTGQKYQFGDTEMEILSSPDDVLSEPVSNLNMLSIVLRFNIMGQQILFGSDAFFNNINLADRWGAYLKSDILQVPHHGFYGGDISAYDLINPQTCLVPTFDEDYYEIFGIKEEFNKHLIYDMSVESFLCGGGKTSPENVFIKLPYAPQMVQNNPERKR